jgi:outer membrane protein assembly factor BamB
MNRTWIAASGVVLALNLGFTAVPPASAASWPVFGHDPARSGVDAGSRILTVANVGMLHSRWQTSFGTVADSAPILLDRVMFGATARVMLFQTAKNGVTYAIDAASGHIAWRFATRGPNITTAAPAADPSGNAIYVPGVDGLIHKLDAATGRPMNAPGFPARITVMTNTEKDASGFNVANGFLYATTSGYYGDAPPYDGHVLSVRLSNGATHVFNTLCSTIRSLPTPSSCSESDSGIWARGGAVVDPDPSMQGRVYATTGNGDFDANTGGHNYGDSVVALSADVSTFLGYYTPADYDQLQAGDVDMGSTSPTLLPREPGSRTPLMLVQGGKDSILRLLDRANLPGVGGELQRINLPGPLFSTPAVWSDSADRTWIFMGFSQEVDAFRLITVAGRSRLVLEWRTRPGSTGGEGTSPVVSNGILFVAFDRALVALNALTGHALWSSASRLAGRSIGPVHWESPIVVNGSVYCADENGHLTAYALGR